MKTLNKVMKSKGAGTFIDGALLAGGGVFGLAVMDLAVSYAKQGANWLADNIKTKIADKQEETKRKKAS